MNGLILLFIVAGVGCLLVAYGLARESFSTLDQWQPPTGGVGRWTAPGRSFTGWRSDRYAGRQYTPADASWRAAWPDETDAEPWADATYDAALHAALLGGYRPPTSGKDVPR